jgi:hypothetical protein
MQLASSHADIAQGVRDGTMGGWFDFLVPDFMTSNPTPAASGPSNAPAMFQSAGATPDTGPGFFTTLAAGLPSIINAGVQAFTTTELMSNPNAAASLIRAQSTPPGVSSPYGPYGIPSGLQLPPGVTPGAYGYPASYYAQAQSFMSGPYAIPIMVGAGGLLLFILMQRKGR